MDNTKQYRQRDVLDLDSQGGFYSTHVNAMTAEGLHSKSDIAAELAFRDARIKHLEDQLSTTTELPHTGLREKIHSAYMFALGKAGVYPEQMDRIKRIVSEELPASPVQEQPNEDVICFRDEKLSTEKVPVYRTALSRSNPITVDDVDRIALEWSDALPPNQGVPYNHQKADTPLGEIVVSWKSWKDHHDAEWEAPWGSGGFGLSPDECRADAERDLADRIKSLIQSHNEQEWISVEEGLPSEDGFPVWSTNGVIVFKSVYRPTRLLFGVEDGFWFHDLDDPTPLPRTTHWCPRHVDTPPPFQSHTDTEGE